MLLGAVAFISSGWDELRVALSTPLRCQKVVVSATLALGIASAYRRSGVVDRALAELRVEKLTYLPENVVLLVSKDLTHRGSLCVAPLGLLVRNAEVIRDSQQVALGYFDAIITATIGGTL